MNDINGTSLKDLVEQNGYGIKVQSSRNNPPFIILRECQGDYEIQYEDGHIGLVMKECPNTNDYTLSNSKGN